MNILNMRYLIQSGQKTAKTARILAKALDLSIVLVLSLFFYPLGLMLGTAYISLADALPLGQSLGKKVFGLGVVSLLDGQYCSYRQSFIRNLPFALPFAIGIIPFIGWIVGGLLLIALGAMEAYFVFKLDSGMRLGDVMSDTTVNGNDPNRFDLKKGQSGWFDQKNPVPMQ